MKKNSYIYVVDSVYALNFVMLTECLSEKRTSHMFIDCDATLFFVHVFFFTSSGFLFFWVPLHLLLAAVAFQLDLWEIFHIYIRDRMRHYSICSWVGVCILSSIRIYSWHTNRRVKEHHVPRESIFWFSSCCSTFVVLLSFCFFSRRLISNPSTISNMLILSSFMIWMVCMC